MTYCANRNRGCPRHAVRGRTDGLCDTCGNAMDHQELIEKLQANLRRDETTATASICEALDFLLERAR